MFTRRRRSFRGRRRSLARQYRTWDVLWQSTVSGASLNSVPEDALVLDSTNSMYIDYGVSGDAQPGDVPTASENYNGPPNNTQSPTLVVPLISPGQFTEHGQEFTIRALHGYIYPLSGASADGGGLSGAATFAMWRLAIGEIEIPRSSYTRLADTTATPLHNFGVLTRRHLGDRQDLKSRFWWMRTFWIGMNQVQNFSVSAAAANFTFVGSQCLERSAFAIHLRRFNFKVSKGRIPVVFASFLGGNGTNVASANTGFSGDFKGFQQESSARLTVSSFVRAFITR